MDEALSGNVNETEEMEIVKCLRDFVAEERGLVGPISSMLNELMTIAEKAEQEITTQMEINSLKVAINNCMLKGRSYVNACEDMSSYVCQGKLMEDLIEDLENGQMEVLLDFVEDMSAYLENCRLRLADFRAVIEGAEKQVQDGTRFDKFADKQKRVKWSHPWVSLCRLLVAGMQRVTSKFEYEDCICRLVAEGANNLDAEFVAEKASNERQKAFLQNIAAALVTFHEGLANVVKAETNMARSLNDMKKCIERLCSTDKPATKKKRKDYSEIIIHLLELRRTMEEIVSHTTK